MKKKIITGIVSSAALVGGATAGILYASESEAKDEEKKKSKVQSSPKIVPSKPTKATPPIYTIFEQQDTIYVDEDGKYHTTMKKDLTDIATIEVIQIGYFENRKEEIQAISRMPKTVEKVPKQLPPEITSTKGMFKDALVFNQDISNWNTSNVVDMSLMFYGAPLFNQNLSGWNVLKVAKHDQFATNAKISNNIANNLPPFLN